MRKRSAVFDVTKGPDPAGRGESPWGHDETESWTRNVGHGGAGAQIVVTMHLGRYQEIADALARHGLGYVLDATGLGRLTTRVAPSVRARPQPVAARHLREALEELGPTFVKLGQVLSTRPDLLPEPYIAELVKLQDSAPSVPFTVIRETIREELGQDPSEFFAWFDPAPLASASIGQAHAARLRDGTDVVVKVRRPEAVARAVNPLQAAVG